MVKNLQNPERKPGLKLTRKAGETIVIGERTTITRTANGWHLVDGEVEIDLYAGTPARGKCYVQAPEEVPVRRGELPKQAA